MFEGEEYREFKALVGENNVSKELRAMIHNFIEQQKNGKALEDPINLQSIKQSLNDMNHINDIYVCSSRQTDINEFIVNAPDYETLRHLRDRGKQIHDVAQRQIMKRMAKEVYN